MVLVPHEIGFCRNLVQGHASEEPVMSEAEGAGIQNLSFHGQVIASTRLSYVIILLP